MRTKPKMACRRGWIQQELHFCLPLRRNVSPFASSAAGLLVSSGIALLPFKANKSKGPAPIAGPEYEKLDIIDEAINYFKANVFFSTFEVKVLHSHVHPMRTHARMHARTHASVPQLLVLSLSLSL